MPHIFEIWSPQSTAMTEAKEGNASSVAASAASQPEESDVANLNSLATLNMLHRQVFPHHHASNGAKLTQLRASVNQFLYPLSKPDAHSSRIKSACLVLILATAIVNLFAEHAEMSSDLLTKFSTNHRRHKGTSHCHHPNGRRV